MSTVTQADTHERLEHVLRVQRSRHDRRASLRNLVRRAAIMLFGATIMIAVVAAVVGLKAFIFLSRMPSFH